MRNFVSWMLIGLGVAMFGYGAIQEKGLRDDYPDKTDRRLWIDHTNDMRMTTGLVLGGFGLLAGGLLMRKP